MRDGARSVFLRKATPNDETFLLQVYASTRSHELEGLGWDDNQKRAFISMQFHAQKRCYPEADNRIILLNERAIGRMLVDRSEAAILLVDIALLTEYRNSGVGTGLIQDLLKEAATAGKPVRLHVLKSNPAVRLYERLGFSIIGSDAAYLEMMWVPAVSQSC